MQCCHFSPFDVSPAGSVSYTHLDVYKRQTQAIGLTGGIAAQTTFVVGNAASAVDHYELSLPTSSISCLPTTVMVTACANTSSPCTSTDTSASGSTATLATTAGTLAATTLTFNSAGVATTTLSYPAAANGTSVSITLSGEQIAATHPRQCCPNGINCSAASSCSCLLYTSRCV